MIILVSIISLLVAHDSDDSPAAPFGAGDRAAAPEWGTVAIRSRKAPLTPGATAQRYTSPACLARRPLPTRSARWPAGGRRLPSRQFHPGARLAWAHSNPAPYGSSRPG